MAFIIFLALLLCYMIWRSKPLEGVGVMSTNELKLVLEDETKFFIDVRQPREYLSRHIPVFNNYPFGGDFTQLPKDKEIVVLCQSGMKSKAVCKELQTLGYTHITYVKGGYAKY